MADELPERCCGRCRWWRPNAKDLYGECRAFVFPKVPNETHCTYGKMCAAFTEKPQEELTDGT